MKSEKGEGTDSLLAKPCLHIPATTLGEKMKNSVSQFVIRFHELNISLVQPEPGPCTQIGLWVHAQLQYHVTAFSICV